MFSVHKIQTPTSVMYLWCLNIKLKISMKRYYTFSKNGNKLTKSKEWKWRKKVEELEKDLIKTSLLWHICHCSFLLLCGPVEMEEQQLTAPLSSCASLHYDSTCRRRATNDRTFALCHQVTSDKLLLSKLLDCVILCALTASSCPQSHSACDDGLLFVFFCFF